MIDYNLKYIKTLGKFIRARLFKLMYPKPEFVEPVFVNLWRKLGINSHHGGSIQQPYWMYQPARLHRLAESVPRLFKRSQIRSTELEFLKRLWGLGTEEEEGYRTGPPGYISWRNSSLESIPGPHTRLKVPEPVFVDLFRRPGIDSQPAGPVRQPNVSYRPARSHRLAKLIPRNRFLGSINIYKYGLCSGIYAKEAFSVPSPHRFF